VDPASIKAVDAVELQGYPPSGFYFLSSLSMRIASLSTWADLRNLSLINFFPCSWTAILWFRWHQTSLQRLRISKGNRSIQSTKTKSTCSRREQTGAEVFDVATNAPDVFGYVRARHIWNARRIRAGSRRGAVVRMNDR